jgi:polysaccharide export outer membrane protein
MTSKPFVIALALVAGAGLAAHAQQASPVSTTPGSPVPASAPPAITDYVIGPEDLLQITVWKNESLSRELAVRPDGKISMPLLHDIQAAGLTPMQLQEKLSTALGEFMPNPEVSVTVTDVRSYRISVLGEVVKPGVLQLKSDTTVLEAIALAGGFRDFASPSKIVILRKNGDGQTNKIPFNYNRVVKDNRAEGNVTLKSGDVVVVP